ncbi:hypothetical protein Pan97_09390 [Bremerella volcania]|uniref:Flagellar protein FliL n=1 Tax=Bremerella volcania TaxID=2527984 RepID=A0A518C3Y4_9BACT|nr:hypothetical protein [Bremerella volcania]QDU73939.1 hypothetical protein Pan97_09390 [Bremerella volcania]
MSQIRNSLAARLSPWFKATWVRIAALAAFVFLVGCGTPYPQKERAAKDMPDALVPVEVDLGKFECTIPNDKTNSTIQIDFHAFAKMPRYKSQELEPLLESHQSRFRHDVLLRVRKFDRPTLNDPDLAQLREALLAAVGEVLKENKIEMVGFYHFQFLEE